MDIFNNTEEENKDIKKNNKKKVYKSLRYKKNIFNENNNKLIIKLQKEKIKIEKNIKDYKNIINTYSLDIIKLKKNAFKNLSKNMDKLEKSNELLKEQNFFINEKLTLEKNISLIDNSIELINVVGETFYYKIFSLLNKKII